MPSSPMKNMIYHALLPFCAPSPRGHMSHTFEGHDLQALSVYEKLLCRHHVLGASLLLSDGRHSAAVYTSTAKPAHHADSATIFRVASITKMATALTALRLIDQGLFALDTPVRELLPATPYAAVLDGVTVRHLLSHTSGLCEPSSLDSALRGGETFDALLAVPGLRKALPGEMMMYSNFGFGLMGCIFEQQTGLCVHEVLAGQLFEPLDMRATLNAAALPEEQIMPISRIMPYRKGQDVTITALGRREVTNPDPLRHFGHTAGAMYTDARSIERMLLLIAGGGVIDGKRLISDALIHEMTSLQASTETRKYGLGLVILERDAISDRRLLGHQGFAYGCVDGAFIEEGTGRRVVFLNGGASEARNGKLGLVNRDVLAWALKKEMPQWK